MKFYLAATAFLIIFISCKRSDTLFQQISSEHSGIHFNNKVEESDSINPLDMEFLYNGGGVAVGDFNNDEKPDLYFTASQVSNKLYLNKGDFKFQDVTAEARVGGEGRWCNAASTIDINNDGMLDLYVCASIKRNPQERTNLLYINQGVGADGVPRFKEMAKQYGLADTGFSVHASFFDYDRDGDLDMYLLTTTLAQRNSTRFDGGSNEHKKALSDKLYRNEGSDSLGHPYYKDVSKDAGISDEGYGLGMAIADVNNDGWKDIYVSNDFFSSDLLYINNRDGTFTDKARQSFKHTAQNAMGTDIADINNDGWGDIITVDMNPEGNYRKKVNMNAANYYVHGQMLSGEYILQYVRNTLQLNNGTVPDSNNKPIPVFSDISFYAGVAETDWSWNPSLADFDNDGLKDLIVTNGYPKDVTDHDFAVFRAELGNVASEEEILEQIPAIKISNYAYKNIDGLKFENTTESWGMNIPSFSDGAVYVDLDNDGDLDYVVNNINEEAFVFKNTLKKENTHYINIRFDGSALNKNGIGTIATLYTKNGKQVFENAPYRGYLSTVDNSLHFGLGEITKVDSLLIVWPDGKQQMIKDIATDKTITINYKDAGNFIQNNVPISPLFLNTTAQNNIVYQHQETDFIDFDIQKLLPYKFSSFGPAIAIGDIDKNGYDDVLIGSAANYSPVYFLQQPNGKFIQKELQTGSDEKKSEAMGVLLFDADNDEDLDVYTASGSYEYAPESKFYQDHLYINDGRGNYRYDSSSIPKNFTSKSCVKATDYDKDGDLDLFIGGRIYPGKYPEPVNSFIYRNDSRNGQIKFTDVSNEVAPFLQKTGLVCDALWTDFDNDGWQDLVLAGEWMPIRFIKNNKGKFTEITSATGIQNKKGWWNSITAGDFDNDGDVDYIAGNLGLNSFFRASEKEPVVIYGGDFNNDQAYDAVPAVFLPDEKGVRKEYPVHVRDEMIKQLVGVRKKFNSYKEYAVATIHDIIPEETIKNGIRLEANYFASSYVENKGNGKFEIRPLPFSVQLSPLNGMVVNDYNKDGNLDIAICGNHFNTEVVNGRYDAMNGQVLLGKGDGSFASLSLQQSGFFVPGDGKGLAQLISNKQYSLLATQNRSTLQMFSLPDTVQTIRFNHDDVYAMVHLSNGKKRKEEIYYGSSFLSQSSRFMIINKSIKAVEVFNTKGTRRLLRF